MISPIEAKELFINKFNIDDYCSKLDESIKHNISSDSCTSDEVVRGFIFENIPVPVLKEIAKKYIDAGWNIVYYRFINDEPPMCDFIMAMDKLPAYEVKLYKVEYNLTHCIEQMEDC